jgi:hypothetical protein
MPPRALNAELAGVSIGSSTCGAGGRDAGYRRRKKTASADAVDDGQDADPATNAPPAARSREPKNGRTASPSLRKYQPYRLPASLERIHDIYHSVSTQGEEGGARKGGLKQCVL